MWEILGEILTDMRVIVGGGIAAIVFALASIRSWINSGKGAGIIVAWAIRKLLKMFTSDDPESQANIQAANTIMTGLMKLPPIKSQFDKIDEWAIKQIDVLEAEILLLKKELIDIDNRIALKIDSDKQIAKMIALKDEILTQIKKLEADVEVSA